LGGGKEPAVGGFQFHAIAAVFGGGAEPNAGVAPGDDEKISVALVQ